MEEDKTKKEEEERTEKEYRPLSFETGNSRGLKSAGSYISAKNAFRYGFSHFDAFARTASHFSRSHLPTEPSVFDARSLIQHRYLVFPSEALPVVARVKDRRPGANLSRGSSLIARGVAPFVGALET